MRKVWVCPCGVKTVFPSDIILPGIPCCGKCGTQMNCELEPGPDVDEMRRLATYIVSEWDLDALINLAATGLVKIYIENNERFEADKAGYWGENHTCTECEKCIGTDHTVECGKRATYCSEVVSDDCII